MVILTSGSGEVFFTVFCFTFAILFVLFPILNFYSSIKARSLLRERYPEVYRDIFRGNPEPLQTLFGFRASIYLISNLIFGFKLFFGKLNYDKDLKRMQGLRWLSYFVFFMIFVVVIMMGLASGL